MNAGFLLLGLIGAALTVICNTDGWRRCVLLGVVNAVCCSILMAPMLWDCLFHGPENLNFEVDWSMRVVGLFVFSLPIVGALLLTPIIVATFMTVTGKAEAWVIRQMFKSGRK